MKHPDQRNGGPIRRSDPWRRIRPVLLGIGLGVVVAAATAEAAEKPALRTRPAARVPTAVTTGPETRWARLKFPISVNEDNWAVNPQGDLTLIDFIRKHTTVNLAPEWHPVDADDLEDLVNYPFIFMTSDWAAELTDRQRANLREYLLRGGFLFADDCISSMRTPEESQLFFRSLARELPKIVPEAKFGPLPKEHPIFHTFFNFPAGLPYLTGARHGLYALILDGRVLAVLSPTDLHCGWLNGDEWYGPGSTEIALKMSTNIYVFAITQGAGQGTAPKR